MHVNLAIPYAFFRNSVNIGIYDPLHDMLPFVQFKKREKHGGMLLLVKLQAKACNFTKSNTLPWVFFTFLKLHNWYQIAQSISYTL